MQRAIAAVVLTLACSVALAQPNIPPNIVTIAPPLPVDGQEVIAKLSGVWRDSCTPLGPRVTRTATDIRVDLIVNPGSGGCSAVLSPWKHDVSLGTLAAGLYSLKVVITDNVSGGVVEEIAAFRVEEGFDYTRVLLPTYSPQPIPGSGGSKFTVRLSAHAAGEVMLFPQTNALGQFAEASVNLFGGKTIVIPDEGGASGALGAGRVLFIRKSQADSVSLSYLLQSEDAAGRFREQWTALPAVRENELRTSAFSIVGIPIKDIYRHTLRVYHLGAVGGGEVLLNFYHQSPTYLAKQIRMKIEGRQGNDKSYPMFFQAGLEALLTPAELASMGPDDMLRVEIIPLRPGAYFGFVSVTDNVTQHAAVFEPQ